MIAWDCITHSLLLHAALKMTLTNSHTCGGNCTLPTALGGARSSLPLHIFPTRAQHPSCVLSSSYNLSRVSWALRAQLPSTSTTAKMTVAADPVAQVLQHVMSSADDWTNAAANYCSEECIKRYLRARNGDVSKASKMLQETLEWRKKMRVDEMSLEEFDQDLKSGLIYLGGNDADGRAVVVMRKRQTPLPPDQVEGYIRYLILVVEAACRSMKGDAEQWVWIMDMANYSRANSPPISVTTSTIKMLQDHYPERMGKAYIINAPTIFEMFWAVVYPVLDPVTRSKVEFVRTKDPAEKSSSSFSLSSWASSFSSSKSSASASSKKEAADTDATAVIAEAPACELSAKAARLTCNSTSFTPLLPAYANPYQLTSFQERLRSLGW